MLGSKREGWENGWENKYLARCFDLRNNESSFTFVDQLQGGEVRAVEVVEEQNFVVHDDQVDVVVAISQYPEGEKRVRVRVEGK